VLSAKTAGVEKSGQWSVVSGERSTGKAAKSLKMMIDEA
jgi:hypothetical protein